MKKILFPFIVICFLFGCSDNNPEPGCFQEVGLGIIEIIRDQPGIIRAPENIFCSNAFVIEPDKKVENRPLRALAPCNLIQEFQINNTRVIFSGYVYERINDGDQCADFFEITEITILPETP